MKTVVLASITGAALALAIAGAACQSSSSGGDTSAAAGPTGAGGDATGGTGAGATGGTGAGAMAGSGATAMGGTGVGTGGTASAGTNAAGGATGGTGPGPGMGGSSAGTSSAGGAGAGGMCGKPGTLHPPDPDAGAASIYCPFGGPMGMGASHCIAQMEHCCEGSVGEVTMCVPIASPCPQMKATDWQCEDPSDCGTGKQCCGNGSVVINADPMCANYASKMTGTTCKTKCDPTMDITMCSADSECPAGKMCIPFSKAGNQVGGCQK